MIHMMQCLCGPARHAIMGMLYDDKDISPEDARAALESQIESAIEMRVIRRRCEICGEDKKEFWYEDRINKLQDRQQAIEHAKGLESQQAATRQFVQATRKAAMN